MISLRHRIPKWDHWWKNREEKRKHYLMNVKNNLKSMPQIYLEGLRQWTKAETARRKKIMSNDDHIIHYLDWKKCSQNVRSELTISQCYLLPITVFVSMIIAKKQNKNDVKSRTHMRRDHYSDVLGILRKKIFRILFCNLVFIMLAQCWHKQLNTSWII